MDYFRSLCAELVESWDANGCDWKPQHQARWEATLARARAALAEGEAVGPSDEELLDCKNRAVRKHLDGYRGPSEVVFSADEILAGQAAGLRAVLARYGSAPRPVPVAERLPGLEDCDAEGLCWVWNFTAYTWGLFRLDLTAHSHWLPAHALPIPENVND